MQKNAINWYFIDRLPNHFLVFLTLLPPIKSHLYLLASIVHIFHICICEGKIPTSLTKLKRMLTIIVRLLALGATISAIIVMVTSQDSAEVLNLKFTAKYSNSPAFKYFVIVEAIASGYTSIVLFISPKSVFRRLVVILDIVTTLLLTSGISAALAIAQVGKKGNSHAGWLPFCDQVPKFCDRVTGSLIAGFAAAIIYFMLNLYSLHAVLN